LHVTAGPAFYVPTGEYNPNDPVGNNIGHNFLTVEPQLNVTYLNKTGASSWRITRGPERPIAEALEGAS
jgi:hypothetical protein